MKDLRKQILAQGFFILTFLNKRKFNRNEGGKSFWLLIFLSECQRKGLSCFGLPMFVNVSKNCFFYIYNWVFKPKKSRKVLTCLFSGCFHNGWKMKMHFVKKTFFNRTSIFEHIDWFIFFLGSFVFGVDVKERVIYDLYCFRFLCC